ncbi:hypothetical protein [Stieleria magnilauensis]
MRVRQRLKMDENHRRLLIEGREVTIKSPDVTDSSFETTWLVLNARGFQTAAEAKAFGERLKLACEVASISSRLGINTGADSFSTFVGESVVDIARQHGMELRGDIHGLDVFKDDEAVRIMSSSASSVSTTSNPTAFFARLSSTFKAVGNLNDGTSKLTYLFNLALMNRDPIAQIVLACSAVEALGQNEKWTESQKQIIAEAAMQVKTIDIGTEEERVEVSDAIQKGVFRLSLRQGVFRLLDRLGLTDLKKLWDELYTLRSTLVHGSTTERGEGHYKLASRVLSLCGVIVLKELGSQIPGVGDDMEMYQPE